MPTTCPPSRVVEISDPTAADAGHRADRAGCGAAPVACRCGHGGWSFASMPPACVFHSTNQRLRTRTSVHQGSARLCHVRPAGAGDGERAAGSPRHDAGRGARIRGPIRGRRRLGEHHLPAPAAGHPRSIWPPANAEDEFRLPQGVETLQADAEKVSRALRLGEATGGDRRTPARPVQRTEEASGSPPRSSCSNPSWRRFGRPDDFAPTRGDRTRQSHSLIVKKRRGLRPDADRRSSLRERPVPGRRR